MDDERRGPIWGFVDGSLSVSASMLLAVLINSCQACNGIWLIGFLKELSDKNAGLIVVATLLLFPTALVIYGGLKMWFSAKAAVERRQRELRQAARESGLEEGRLAERKRIEQAFSQMLEERGISLSDEEITRILDGEPAPPPPSSRPYRRRSSRGSNSR